MLHARRTEGSSFSRLSRPAIIALALGAVLASACGEPAGSAPDLDISLYALVQTVDGTYFYPPLGPSPVPTTGTFDATLTNRLQVVLESTSTDGEVRTVALFDARSSPALTLLRTYETYLVNLPAATYFTNPALAYRFRVLLDGYELGRSDLSSYVFTVLQTVPTLQVGVKLRIETRPVPSISSITPASVARNTTGVTLTVTGTRFSSDSVVRFNGAPLPTRPGAAGQLLIDLPDLTLTVPGTYAVAVYTPAPGGGTSANATLSVFDPPPALTSASPSAASAGDPGMILTLHGSLFTDASTVRFDGAALQTTFLSDHELLALLPASSLENAGTRALTVLSPPSLVSAPITFVVSNPLPVLGAVSPTSAMAASNGATLTITGAGFTRQTTALFDGQARSTSWASPTLVYATLGANDVASPGTHTITVSSPAPGGGSQGSATFAVTSPVPSISALSPSAVVFGGGDLTLSVSGGSLLSGATVLWNGAPLATTYVSRNLLTARVPSALLASTGTAEVTVENPQPFESGSNALTFTVQNPAPTITALSPVGATTGQQRVILTVSGTSFLPAAVVSFRGTAVTTTYQSSTRLVADVPASLLGSAGNVTVSVANPAPAAGTASDSSFQISNPIPTVTSITPSSVPVGAATFTLTVDGTNFLPGPYTVLDGRELVYRSYVSPTRITIVVPADRLTVAGSYGLTVRNALPTPGWSTPVDLTVTDATCTDGVRNGDETSIDCGGSTCRPCVVQNCTPGDPTCTELSVGLFSRGGNASASDASASASFVNDGNASVSNTGWGNARNQDSRLMLRFARAFELFQLNVFWGGSNSGWHQGTSYYLPTQMQVQYSNDPAALASDPVTSSRWTVLTDNTNLLASTFGTVSGAEILPGFTDSSWGQTQTISFNRVTATAVRLVFDGRPSSNGGTNYVGLVGELDAVAAVTPDGEPCTTAASCASGVCDASGVCAAATCADGVQNGAETDVDCGGSCGACTPGHRCGSGADCTDQVCTDDVCQAASCTDHVKNGTETDLDCGGSCPRCANGATCAAASDCTSSVCTASTCAVPSCFDGVRNGTESDVDCGQVCALRCDVGQRCTVSLDCTTGLCTAGHCDIPDAVLTSLSPGSVTAGSGALTLTLSGSAFMGNAVVTFGGVALAATVQSTSQLTVPVPASLLASAGTAEVVVTNPGTTTDSRRTFTIYNPTPVVSAISPTTLPAQSTSFTLTVDGASFMPSAVVSWGSTALVTSFVSATRLTAVVPATLVSAGGSFAVTVSNPAPSPVSNAVVFAVTASCSGTFTSCASVPATCSSGVYQLAPRQGVSLTAYCDMSTAGGGWTLVLAYAHTGGQNNALVPGVAPTDPARGYSHMSTTQLQALPWNEMRLYCETSAHTRKVDYRTTNSGAINYFKGTAANDSSYWAAGGTYLYDHDGHLPAAAASGFNEVASGEQRMTNFPFYLGGTYHWGIRGSGSRWECDDYPNGAGNTTLHQVWVRDNTQLGSTAQYATCTDILLAGLSHGDGVYDTSGGRVYCDMTTDGGGWTLALAYQHAAGQNAALVPGVPPLSPSTGYSHLSNSVLGQMPWTEMRLTCRTSGHPRVVDFKTTVSGAVRYFKGTASNATSYWTSGFTALAGHTAHLPAAANNGFNQDATLDDRLTNFPFYLSGTYHWGIRGAGSRWECDDYPGGAGNTTNHQIWLRDRAAIQCTNGVQDQGETGVDCGGPCANACYGSCAAQGTYASCAAVPSGCTSGVYTLASGSGTFEGYCDTTTAGGGWLLALSYNHLANDNLALVPGTVPRDPNNGYSHLSSAQLQAYPWSTMRLYCRTSAHTRVMHFQTSSAATGYFRGTGSNLTSYWTTGFTALAGHSANLPAATDSVYNQAVSLEDRMTNFPFYRGSTYHWGVRGLNGRWECDDFPNGAANDTLHQVWVK